MTALSHRASQIADVIRRRHPAGISKMLVVGCGDGREAHALANALRCDVTGIDLRDHFPRYRDALADMNRVLAKGGGLWIGTPNRARMLGYIGGKVSLRKMIQWNAADWSARLRGRFRNELGTHAGFTLRELGGELRAVFNRMDDATLDYYLAIYPHRARTVRLLQNSGLGTFAFPSIYFVGQKN